MRKLYQFWLPILVCLAVTTSLWLDGSLVVETKVQGVKQSHKMTMKSVVVHCKLDGFLFVVPKIR